MNKQTFQDISTTTLHGEVILEYIPATTASPPPIVRVVRELRATLELSLESALVLARSVHGENGSVVVFTGEVVEARKFADRLVACGCVAKFVVVEPSQPHPAHTTADWLKDFKDRNTLGGNEQAAFRTVIDILEEYGDSSYE